MNLGNFGRALGYGTIGGLGTAEEQRQREMKMLEVGMNLALRREALKHQQKQLAETRRQHDLPYGEADYTPYLNLIREREGLPPLPAGAVKAPRNVGGSLISGYGAASKPQTVTLEELYGDMEGMGYPVKRPQVMQNVPAEEDLGFGQTAPAVSREVDPKRTAELLQQKRPVSYAQALIGHVPKPPTLHERWEQRKLESAETKEAERQRQITEARAIYVETQDLNKALAGRPLVKAEDVYGYVPAAPDRPASTLEATILPILATPEASWTQEQKRQVEEWRKSKSKEPTPRTLDQARKDAAEADIAELKLQATRLEAEAADVEEAMAQNKPISTKARNLAASSLERAAETYQFAGDNANAKDRLARADEIRRYKPGQPKREPMSRKDARYPALRKRGLTDEQIQRQFNLRLVD